ncbi:MAG: c-type cytochrome domain-containing protein [Saprospiraceae bacterium]
MRKIQPTIFWILCLGGLLVFFATCQHAPYIPDPGDMNPVDTTHNPVDTFPGTGGMGHICDPDSVYFSLQILPILQSNCAFSGCHDAASHQDGVVLTSYTSVINTAQVRPFDLGDSELYEVITESDPDKVMPPPPSSRLSAEQISLIERWILQGAQDLNCDPAATGCDTTSVSFSNTVLPILQTYCVGCHSGNPPSGGINLSNYGGVQTVAANGRLAGSIRHDNGYQPMPQGGNQLSDCYIGQIVAWINAGALNN